MATTVAFLIVLRDLRLQLKYRAVILDLSTFPLHFMLLVVNKVIFFLEFASDIIDYIVVVEDIRVLILTIFLLIRKRFSLRAKFAGATVCMLLH